MSFQQGLSGLNATSQHLQIIGNNIANANTYGSKVARAEFSDVYATALNGSGTQSIGIGTTLQLIALNANGLTGGSRGLTDIPRPLAGLADGVSGRNLLLLFVAIGAVSWLDIARVVRGQTQSLRQREFVIAAQAQRLADSAALYQALGGGESEKLPRASAGDAG